MPVKLKAPPPVADINVTPMVDVMLVLLIIFMVITPMLSKGISVDMVKTNYPLEMKKADQDDAVLIAITKEGNVFLKTNLLKQPEDLAREVGPTIEKREDKTCYIRADSRAKYGKVVQVVNNLRSIRVDQIGLLTEGKPKVRTEAAK